MNAPDPRGAPSLPVMTWAVYAARDSGKQYLGTIRAAVPLARDIPADSLARMAARWEYLTLLKHDDLEVEPAAPYTWEQVRQLRGS